MDYFKLYRVFFILIISSFSQLSCSEGTLKEKKPELKSMELLNSDAIYSKLNFKDEEFVNLSDDKLSDLSEELSFLHEDENSPPDPSVQIKIPGLVFNGSHELFSIIGLVSNGQRKWEVNPTTNIFLAIRHVDSGEIWLRNTFINNRRGIVQPPSGDGKAPNEFQAASWSVGLKKVNVFDSFPVDLPKGDYIAAVLYFDLKSITQKFSIVDRTKPDIDGRLPDVKVKSIKVDVTTNQTQIETQQLYVNVQLLEPISGEWKGNIIVLSVDEKPVILSVVKNLGNTPVESFLVTVDVDLNGQSWKSGGYQVYIDTGSSIDGPIKLDVDI